MNKNPLKVSAKGTCLGMLILLFVAIPQCLQAVEYPLSIYAGSGRPGLQDGIQAKAGFNEPYGLAVDSRGHIYVADSYNNLIRIIANGIVGTVAGSGNGQDAYGFPRGGYADGAVAKAKFNRPRAVVVAAEDTIYVADTGNHIIRKIYKGRVTTFAGTGKAGYRNGTALQAQFNAPSGLAVDTKGNLFVADTLNNVIRKITPAGAVSTYAGKSTGEAGFRDGAAANALFNEPVALAMDSKEDLYVADSANQLIRKIAGGKVETLAGFRGELISGTDYYQGSYQNGPAQEAAFNFPKGMTVLENGTVIVADTWNYRVRAVLPQGRVITLAGTGKSGKEEGSIDKAIIGAPVGVVSFQNKLYVADTDNSVIWQININPDNLQARLEFAEPGQDIQVWVDSKRLELQEETKPYIYKERTMLPLRNIAEELGCKVDWAQDGTITVTRGEVQKIFTAKDQNLQNNNGHTMVGIRYLAESLGCTVDWVPEYRAVTVTAR